MLEAADVDGALLAGLKVAAANAEVRGRAYLGKDGKRSWVSLHTTSLEVGLEAYAIKSLYCSFTL